MTRTLSEEGYRLLRSFEGYHDEMPDGRCRAYYCPSGVLTIGYGTIHGIKEGDIWTREQAEAAMRAEVADVERDVARLVTVDIVQHEFDALVLLGYNIGCGRDGLAGSTVLRRLNAGDKVGAAEAFKMWDKGRDRDGNLIVLPGLVSRREREAAHFLKPDAPPAKPYMSQDPVETVPWPPWLKLVLNWLGGGVTLTTIVTYLETIASGVQIAATNLSDFVVWAIENPVAAAPIVAGIAIAAWPKIRGRLA